MQGNTYSYFFWYTLICQYVAFFMKFVCRVEEGSVCQYEKLRRIAWLHINILHRKSVQVTVNYTYHSNRTRMCQSF